MGRNLFSELRHNLIYSVRALRRSPLFTAVAVLSLALGIGANTAVFSFVRAIVLEKLPVAGAERLVILRQNNEAFHMQNCCFPYRFYQQLRNQDAGFEDVLAVNDDEVNFDDRGETERVRAEFVSGNYFHMLGVRAAVGRLPNESDDRTEGSGAVCVISNRFWRERYDGSRDVLGRRILINGQPLQIIGVAERGFQGSALHDPHDLEIPEVMQPRIAGNPGDQFRWAQLLARLKPGVTPAQAQQRLNAIGLALEKEVGFPMSPRDAFLLEDGSQGLDSKKQQFGKPVLVLLLLVAVVLLIACANLAALLMVRSVQRTREAGVRIALGASRAALIRRFFTESLLVAVFGGACGWLAATALVRVLLSLLGAQAEGIAEHVRPDMGMLAFSAAVTITCSILFGMLPAWRASLADPIQAIHGSDARLTPGQSLLSRALIAGQVALSLALLFGAGLFARTLHNLRGIDLGFQPEHVVLLHVDLSHTAHAGAAAGPFFNELLQRVKEFPETRSASLAGISVLSGSMAAIVVRVPSYAPPHGLMPTTYFTRVSAGYFRTLGIPLLQGRDFNASDTGSEGARAAIVNRRFASQFFKGDALGKTFTYGGGRSVTIAGIAGDSKFRWIREDPQPIMYLPVAAPGFPQDLYLQVRASADAGGMIERLRTLVRNMDRNVPIDSVTTMAIQIDQALARERLLTFLSSLMGALAVLLAAIGLYGVLSFSVARRTREIGVRLAVGASRARIVGIFLRESAWMIGAGFAMGLPLALACGKVASSLLYNLTGQDPATAIAAVAALALVAFAATVIPAWRAARVDATVALRHE